MFKATLEQNEIIETIAKADHTMHVVVQAGPGSGKTTTAIEAMKRLPKDAKIIFVCFNKRIAEENAKKVPSNVTVQTLNSVGWCACLKGLNIKGFHRVDEYKTQNILQAHLDGKWDKESKSFKFASEDNAKLYSRSVAPIKQIVALAKANAVYEPSRQALEEIADEYQIDFNKLDTDVFFNLALVIYTKCINDKSKQDWDDQIFFTMKYNFPLPKYDYVFVDEAQDLNKVQFDLILQLNK